MNIQSKIKGALYGFAIGDAMGATTEFLTEYEVKKVYGEVRDIIGGGWLALEPGEVTDDTQMTMCVCEAIERFPDERNYTEMLDACCENFVKWYKSNPKDIGGCCRKVIGNCSMLVCYESWQTYADDPESLGNGSLMRTMPIVLAGLSEDLAISQGRLTHNNILCDNAIEIYYREMEKLLYFNKHRQHAMALTEPTGHVLKTLNNALYWVQNSLNLEEAIVNAVNHGGDADTIAAITGSMAGALYGYEAIPQRWIEQLSPQVKSDLDKYTKLFEKLTKRYVQSNKYIV